MSERLERVTAFSELREGMIVVCGPCPCHGKRHRSMLLGKEWLDLNPGLGSPGGVSDCFPLSPPPEGNDKIRITPGFVAAGQVYRVIDGLEEPSTETAAASGTTRRTPQKERA